MPENSVEKKDCALCKEKINSRFEYTNKNVEDIKNDLKSTEATVKELDNSYPVINEKLKNIEASISSIKNWFARGVVTLIVSGIGGLIGYIMSHQ